MNSKIKVAIVGAGIGREHKEAYLELPDRYHLVAMCDTNEERVKEVVGGNSDIQIVTDIDNLFSDPSIDLIDICLPPHLHFDMSMKALAAGKHVVCEKPMVSSLKEADLLKAQAEKHNRILTPVFQYRFGPAMSKLRALIDAGLTGRPFVASIETHWHRDAEYFAVPWRGTWKGEQGGAVLGHAIHNHDLLCSVFGPVKRLTAMTNTLVNDVECEDCAAISFQMENGALASSSVTLGAADDTTRIRFCFEKLTAESGKLPYRPAEGEWTFTARGDASQDAVDEVLAAVKDSRTGFAGFFEALADALENKKNDAVTIDDGRRSLELVSAIYQSARNAEVIQLPLSEGSEYYEGWTPDILSGEK